MLKKCQEQLLGLLGIKCEDLPIGTHSITITKDNTGCTIGTSLLSCPSGYILSGGSCIPCGGLNQPACTGGVCNAGLVNVNGVCVADTAPTGNGNVTVSGIQGSPITPVVVPGCGNTQGQTITYSIVGTLPNGIVFDPNTRTFSGTYTGTCPNTSSVIMRCTDSNGNYGDTTIVFQFSCPMPGPITGLQVTDGNGGAYDCGDPILSWNASNNTSYYQIMDGAIIVATNITGTTYTITGSSIGSHTYSVLPCGPSGCNTGVDITVNVIACNNAPISGGTQSYNVTTGTAFSQTMIGCTDPEGGTLTYSMSGLPSGFSFDPLTRIVSGTYSGSCPTTINSILTCSDGTNSTNTTITFNIVCGVPLYSDTYCFPAGTLVDNTILYHTFVGVPAGQYTLSWNLSGVQDNQFGLPGGELQVSYRYTFGGTGYGLGSGSSFVNHCPPSCGHGSPYSASGSVNGSVSGILYGDPPQNITFGLNVELSTIPRIILDGSSCVTLIQTS